MLRSEIKKLMSFRVIWILLICFLFLSGYVQITKAYDRYYTPSEYKSYISELCGMTLQEVYDYTNKKSDDPHNENRNGYLYFDILEITEQLMNYPEYLNSIKTNAENMSAASIWGEKDSFSNRNVQKTPSAYEGLKGTTLKIDTSLGIEDLLDSPITDILAIFLLFVGICRIFLRDRELGMISLLYSTPKGRGSLISCKILTSILWSGLLVIVFYGEAILISGILYGLGDLSRPIQCIYGYYMCNLPVSVGEYIVISGLLKMAAYAVFAVIFAVICTISKNNLSVYGISAAVTGLFYLLYEKIPVLSPMSIFHFWNPIQFMQGKEILGTYTNVNLLGYPVSLKISVCIVIASVIAFLIFICIQLFKNIRILQYRNINPLNKLHFRLHIKSKFGYTCYRFMILQKGILIVLGIILVSAGMFNTFARNYNNDDIYYENFCNQYEGIVTEDTMEFISEKREYYAEIENSIAEIQKSSVTNAYSLNKLYSEFDDKNAFEKFARRAQAISDSSEIFYDTGYTRYFSLDGNNDNKIQMLFLAVALVLIMCPIPSYDRQSNMTMIIFTTKTGKKGYYKQLLLFASVVAVLFTLIISIPYLIQILHKYGTQGFTAPLSSIFEFADKKYPLNVGQAMITVVAARMILTSVCSCIITVISSRCKSIITAYCINTVIFILPIILLLLEVNI